MNLEAAFQISKNVIIMGDLNKDLLNSTFHHLNDIIVVNSMMNVINIPTRGNALLDPILVPTDLEYSDCGTCTLPQAITDHCATYISIHFPYQTQPCSERTIWLYKRANYELLNQKVSDYNWNVLLNGSVDESCATFTRIFIDIVSQCILVLNCNDKRGFWKIIKHFLKKDKSVSCFPPLCETLSSWEIVWYTSTQEKADCLKQLFYIDIDGR